MITLTAKIELVPSEKNGMKNISIGNNDTNIPQSVEIVDILNDKRKLNTAKPFMLGISKLGGGDVFMDNVDYFIGKKVANEQGKFAPTPYNIIITGENITIFTIRFDNVNHRHPTSIIVNGKTYTDDDYEYTIKLDTPVNELNIVIDNWNTPFYPLVISGIYVITHNIDIDKRNLISIKAPTMDRGTIEMPSYGIVSNVGEIVFNDLDSNILDYAQQQLLSDGLKVEIMLNDTLSKVSDIIGVYDTKKWNYDNDNRVVNLEIQDDLEEWQNINVPPISYNPKQPQTKSFLWLYEYLHKITTKYGYNMLSSEVLDLETKNILKNTIIQYPLLRSGSLWQQWTKLCISTRSRIYKYNDTIVFEHTK